MNNRAFLTPHEDYINNSSPLEMLYTALAYHGIPRPKHIKHDGFTRWGKNNRYWAVVRYDGYCFGDYANSLSSSVFPKKRCSKKEWQERKKAEWLAKQEAQRLEDEKHAESARLAREIWNTAIEVEDDFPYLKNKQISSFGLGTVCKDQLTSVRFNIISAFGFEFAERSERFVIIPLININGAISSLQFINSAGDKRFLPCGCKKGCYFAIGNFKGKILFCEGYATGASIYMATGELTICCFDAGNLKSVAEELKEAFKEHYPSAEIIICADNDAFKENNTGIEKAVDAGNSIEASVIFPVFKDTSKKPTDFNDLHNLEGLDAVKEQISRAFRGDVQ